MRRKILCTFLVTLYILGAVYFILKREYGQLPLVGFCAGFTLVMYYLVSREIEPVDDGIYVTLTGFVFMASFLGSCLGFYDIVSGYDDFLHVWSGIVCSQVGFVTVKHFWETENTMSRGKRVFLLLFVFFFTMGCAALWEIFEFGSDVLFRTNMQAGGLADTCTDMIDALIGCGIILPHINSLINKIPQNA